MKDTAKRAIVTVIVFVIIYVLSGPIICLLYTSSELKPRITENGIDYILVGDYYIPDLKLPEEHRPIGKYGRLHREYLREAHPARLNTLTLTGELWTCLLYTSGMKQFMAN